MTIDSATGAITWTPTASQLGLNPVEIALSDSHGGVCEQKFSIAFLVTMSRGRMLRRTSSMTASPDASA